ncbi:MAG: SDR family NAD(P)-dependent oxidoreductase, partial [Propionibacteriaceae bacterium]|nr:SDR family NAD(P)-dependent oxidoreductase [Propionibacteriaceae bacterium]
MSRVVLVTGASSGIGRATAREAARRGNHVVLLARGVGPLEESAAECSALGAASTRVFPIDISDVVAVRSAV